MTNAELLAKLDALGTDDEKSAFVDENSAALKAAIDELVVKDPGDAKVVSEELTDEELSEAAGGFGPIVYGCKICRTIFPTLAILVQHKIIYKHYF